MIKKMLLSFFLFFTLIAFSQSDIWEVYERSDRPSWIEHCVNFDEVQNKSLLIYSETASNEFNHYSIRSRLKLLDNKGETIVEKELSIDSLKSFYLLQGYYMKTTRELILLGGATTLKQNGGRKYLLHYVLDINLQVKKINIIPQGDTFSVFQIECNPTLVEDEFTCACVSVTQVTKPSMNYLFKLNKDSILNYNERYVNNFGHLIWNVFQSPYDSTYYGINYEALKLSNELAIIGSVPNARFFGSSTVDVRLNNGKILFSDQSSYLNNFKDIFGHFIAYLDTSLIFKDYTGVGIKDISRALWKNQIDLKLKDKIFGVAENHIIGFGPFKFFDLALFDEDLNKEWEIKFGETTGRRMRPLGITATYDCGAIVYGHTMTNVGQKVLFEPFYIKFDDKGAVVNTSDVNMDQLISIKTFPNPTSDYFYIECQTNKELTIEIYNNAGVKLDEYNIVDNKINIDVRHYSSNMYHYKIMNKKGEVYASGSFVKN
ncbi:MAG: Secretion system C-terminal sorting domain [Bacteroidota bacterium]|jgi:hypothetical protein